MTTVRSVLRLYSTLDMEWPVPTSRKMRGITCPYFWVRRASDLHTTCVLIVLPVRKHPESDRDVPTESLQIRLSLFRRDPSP